MRGRGVTATTLAAVCLLAALGPAGAAGVGAASDDGGQAMVRDTGQVTARDSGQASRGIGSLQTGDVETDAVLLRADVQDDGDAVWTIQYRVRLDDENTTEAFRGLQADIRANSTAYTDQFARRMRSTVAAAENATGRAMAVRNVSVSASIRQLGNAYGVVTYRFVWTNFAAVEGQRLIVGDALSGFFLDSETTLVVAWPERYQTVRVTPPPAERSADSVTWTGPRDFGQGEPRLVLAPESPLPASLPVLVGGVVALLVVLAGAWYWRERGETGATDERAPESPAADTSAPPNEAEPPGEAEPSTESTQPGTGASGGQAGTNEPEDPVDEELLSPQERVLRLLDANGGRMKQKAVTERLDWSAARTSQVVGDLRDAGKVESFRLGRENVLKFPDEKGPEDVDWNRDEDE